MRSVFEDFEHGVLTIQGVDTEISALPWTPHKDFAGVFIKNIIQPGTSCAGLSCCLVRIEPDCAIGMHTHPASIELHEVIDGDGLCLTEQGEIAYKPGSMAVMPVGTPHEVKAGSAGLRLLAKFVAL